MILLDTHVWLWWLEPDLGRLPASLRSHLEMADDLAISTISIYELCLNVRRGRIQLTLPLDEWIKEALEPSSVRAVAPDETIAQRAALLPPVHGDPLDRLLIATALQHGAQLISMDNVFPQYSELAGLLIGRE